MHIWKGKCSGSETWSWTGLMTSWQLASKLLSLEIYVDIRSLSSLCSAAIKAGTASMWTGGRGFIFYDEHEQQSWILSLKVNCGYWGLSVSPCALWSHWVVLHFSWCFLQLQWEFGICFKKYKKISWDTVLTGVLSRVVNHGLQEKTPTGLLCYTSFPLEHSNLILSIALKSLPTTRCLYI